MRLDSRLQWNGLSYDANTEFVVPSKAGIQVFCLALLRSYNNFIDLSQYCGF